jgi:hypothetical protein
MLKSLVVSLTVLAALAATPVFADGASRYRYAEIAKRYQSQALGKKDLAWAKMQGECLVGLKEINFRKKTQFDPIAEWTNLRSWSLLEQFPPCQVLVMIEVAKKALDK